VHWRYQLAFVSALRKCNYSDYYLVDGIYEVMGSAFSVIIFSFATSLFVLRNKLFEKAFSEEFDEV
jgi:hypothetical protein